MGRSVADWLTWQESLHPAGIALGLDRVHSVAARLDLSPPPAHTVVIGGTNGKGSTSAFVERFLRGGLRTGAYSSPHLLRYNERICVNGVPVEDGILVSAFETVEAARANVPLTYFEFGTLAALEVFSRLHCTAWVLEVGLGGRLDAVNIVEPSVAIITTIGLDHQDWLGDDLASIAREKAGIMRPGVPVLFGSADLPAEIADAAAETGAPLFWPEHGFSLTEVDTEFEWRGRSQSLRFDAQRGPQRHQLDNLSVALAAVELIEPGLLPSEADIQDALARGIPPGRCQLLPGRPRWIIDVAHNSQAARVLRQSLDTLAAGGHTSVVVGMLGDKDVGGFARELEGAADAWYTCSIDDARGLTDEELATRMCPVVGVPVTAAGSLQDAMRQAVSHTPPDGVIVVCGSFHVAGPAIAKLLPMLTVP